MARTKRKFIIVGNWKMNPDTLEDAKKLRSAFEKKAKKSPNVTVVLCPPASFLPEISKSITALHIGAQDVDSRPRGAFTGSISARQVHEAGAEYTIIGHSERRAAGDTNEVVAQKVGQALEAGLRVIICVGEKERDTQGKYLRDIREQIAAFMVSMDKSKLRWITIAYEPVWAIGKSYNVALSPADIHEMCIYIKKTVAETAGKDLALKTHVLYGGSVDFENAKKILADGAVDGLLVGRQSLDVENFSNIIDYASNL